MPRKTASSYRTMLLASAAGVAAFAAAGGPRAAAAPITITVSTPQSGTSTLQTLTGGDNLTVTDTGALTITSAGTGSQATVAVTSPGGGGTIANAGTIVNDQFAGVRVFAGGGTLGAISNLSGGVIAATGTGSWAIYNGGTIGSITNAGGGTIAAGTIGVGILDKGSAGIILNSAGGVIEGGAQGIYVNGAANSIVNSGGTISGATGISNGGTIGAISNTAGGLILGGGYGFGIDNAVGAIGSISNAGGTIAVGDHGTGISNGGSIGSIGNSAGGVIQAGSYGIGINNSGTIGAITNTGGTILTGASGEAIYNKFGSVGSIANLAGAVIQAGNNGDAIKNLNGSIGSITNTGGAILTGDNDGAIDNHGTIGSITNTGGVIQGGANGTAVYNYYNGRIGSITNSGGTFQTGSNGNTIDNYGGTIGSITNTGGVIQAGTSGYGIFSSGTIGSITNTRGTIAAGSSGRGIDNYYGVIGSVTNAGGTIAGGSAGIRNIAGSIGTIVNSDGGLIQAGFLGAGSDNDAIENDHATIGSIDNTGGIILAGVSSTAIDNKGSIGTIVNTGGTILAGAGGVGIQDNGTLGIVINGTGGLIQGGPTNGSGIAIDASAAYAPLSIVNAGTIIGAIKQSAHGDTLTVTGGAIIGNVLGQPGSHGVVDFALGSGSFTTGGSIIGVDNVTLASGTLVMAPGGGTVSGAQVFDILSGGHAELGSTLGAALTSNAGILDVGTNKATVAGNFTQTAGGSLEIGVNGSTLGELTVTGTATVTPGPRSVVLHFEGPANNLPSNATILDAQGGLILTSGTTLTAVSDNPNPYFSSPLVTDPPGVLVLNFAAPTQSALLAYAGGLFPTSTSGYLTTAASAYAARIATLNESTFNSITNALTALAPAQRVAFEQQAAPRSVASAAAELADGLGANTALDRAMADRQMASRDPGGEPAGHGVVAWAQPFVSTAYQSSVQGFDGFSATTYGAALGADARIAPDIRLGVAFAAGDSMIDYTGGSAGNQDTMTSAEVGVYGSYTRPRFFVDAALSGGYDWYTSKQTMAFLGQQTGSAGGTQFTAQARVGTHLSLGDGAVLTPSVSLRELHMNFDGYTMSGGIGPSAHINANSLDLVQSRVGAQLVYPVTQVGGWTLQPQVHAYYVHDFETTGVTTAGGFGNGLGFSVTAPSRDANLADVGLAVAASRAGAFTVSASASFTGGRSTDIGTFLLHIAKRF